MANGEENALIPSDDDFSDLIGIRPLTAENVRLRRPADFG
jgi:hypothetical protein